MTKLFLELEFQHLFSTRKINSNKKKSSQIWWFSWLQWIQKIKVFKFNAEKDKYIFLTENCHRKFRNLPLTLLHAERPKLYTILAFLSAVGLNAQHICYIGMEVEGDYEGEALLIIYDKLQKLAQ